MGGFLEFLNSQPESVQQRYLVQLKLLMERAATPGTAYEISTFQSIQQLKLGICLFNSLTRSRIGHKLSSLMPTCLQLRPLLAFQPCLLKRATARKTPIAKSGITQASVTARYQSDIQENSPLPCLRCRPRNATMCETLLPNP